MRESSLLSRRELNNQIHSLLERGREILEGGYDRSKDIVGRQLEAGLEKASDSWYSTKKYAVKKARRVDRTIHQHPYQALAIAAGVGLIVGVLLCSRRED